MRSGSTMNTTRNFSFSAPEVSKTQRIGDFLTATNTERKKDTWHGVFFDGYGGGEGIRTPVRR